jgi:hypothetical protein
MHDGFDFGRCALELPRAALELISHSLAQRGNAWLKALHLAQHLVDRIEGFFQPIVRRHVTSLSQHRQFSLAGRSRSPHRLEQCGDIDLRGAQCVSRLGIRYLLNMALDLGNKTGSLLGIAGAMREQVHEIIHTPRRRFQLVTIDSVVFEVHERVARLRKARAE